MRSPVIPQATDWLTLANARRHLMLLLVKIKVSKVPHDRPVATLKKTGYAEA